MEKRDQSIIRNRAFLLIILGLFLFSFSMNIVSAAQPFDWFGEKFSEWESGTQFSSGFAKILLTILVIIVVYGVVAEIPGVGDLEWYWKLLFSGIVGFLSFAYITPDEVYGLMTSYNALGFTLGAFIPFIILAAFSFRIATKGVGKGSQERITYKALAMLLWFSFAGFSWLRVFRLGVSVNIDPLGSVSALWLSIIIAIIATIIAFLIPTIYAWVLKSALEEARGKSSETIENAGQVAKDLSDNFVLNNKD